MVVMAVPVAPLRGRREFRLSVRFRFVLRGEETRQRKKDVCGVVVRPCGFFRVWVGARMSFSFSFFFLLPKAHQAHQAV